MRRRRRPEHGGVGVERMLEIIERAFFQPLEHEAEVFVRGARAELIVARAEASFQHRHDAAEMMGDDLQVRILVHDARIDQPHHRRAGLVGPAERPPDFVFRFRLGQIIGGIRRARRMQPDRLVELVHGGEERLEGRVVERLAGDVGVDLHAKRAVLDGTLAFAHAGIGGADRRLRHPAGKMIGIFGADVGKSVVHHLGHVLDLGAFGEEFERRHRVGEDLRVVLEPIDDLLAQVEIVDAGNVAHALADVRIAAVHQLGEKFLRNEMGIGVDAHALLRD